MARRPVADLRENKGSGHWGQAEVWAALIHRHVKARGLPANGDEALTCQGEYHTWAAPPCKIFAGGLAKHVDEHADAVVSLLVSSGP